MRWVQLALTAALLAGSIGCAKSKCESVCEAANECKAPDRTFDVECVPFCDDVEAFHSRAKAALSSANCSDLWDEHLACWETNKDKICDTTFADCQSTADDYLACAKTYCDSDAGKIGSAATNNQPDPRCYVSEDDNGDPVGDPALSTF